MRYLVFCFSICVLTAPHVSRATDPVAMRVETLTVPPSTQPLVFVITKNLRRATYHGNVTLQGPDDWRFAPSRREVTLEPGETQRLAFNLEKARNREANLYSFQATATSDAGAVTRQQESFVASAPYFKITADGRADEWKDAIPITFTTGGKRTVISTYWNRRSFSLLVAVQEDRLTRCTVEGASAPFDAIQFSLAPLEPETAANEPTADRFEFLIAATQAGAKCFQLAEMTTPLAATQAARPLASLVYEDADVAVRRNGDTTWYECSLSFRPMRDAIMPSEGREFFMSVLVHDPDGTNIRDLGRHAQLWPSDNDLNGWSRWPGAAWGDEPPRGPRIRWGMCTSKY